MDSKGFSHIAMVVCAVIAAVVLFMSYGTMLPSLPFQPIPLDRPTIADSDGQMTAVVDTETRRVLVLDANGDLTGAIDCTPADCPVDVITDVCVSEGRVYLSGCILEPDSNLVSGERVVAYDRSGVLQGIVYEDSGRLIAVPLIKQLCDAPGGIVISREDYIMRQVDTVPDELLESLNGEQPVEGTATTIESQIKFIFANENETRELRTVDGTLLELYDVAFDADGEGHYVTLDRFGMLGDGTGWLDSRIHDGHIFTSVDIDGDGTVYACDDVTGSMCAIPADASEMRVLVPGSGYDNVSENHGVISLCDVDSNTVVLCDTTGSVTNTFDAVKQSMGFSIHLLLVWMSGLYLVLLALVSAVREVHRRVKAGDTDGFGPMFMSVAVVLALGVAIANLTYASYERSLEIRTNEIQMCTSYLLNEVPGLSESMEKANDRDALWAPSYEDTEAMVALNQAAEPATNLVASGNLSGVGLYYALYGKDENGVFYLTGSADEYVVGSSARTPDIDMLEKAFSWGFDSGAVYHGRSLRDTTVYQIVQIPKADYSGVVGVIEIGSKMRSFEASLNNTLALRVLGLLVMVLVVYLSYVEIRAIGRRLLSYRMRRQDDPVGSIALLTRPFTLTITMLTSIDTVMAVLIARDLLANAGISDASPLLALPILMLGIGLVLGQMLYGALGLRVGLRRFILFGAFAMMICASLTSLAVASGVFWLYCAAKLVMSVMFGMLYALGYSLPRLANNDEDASDASSEVKRTDTSAAALGTVLGGYAAYGLGNAWVYAIVAIACLPIIMMALNLLPKGIGPLERLAQSTRADGRIRDFVRTPIALGLGLFIIFPTMLATGYASFLFPVFSADIGLSSADINNIYVLGQLIVFSSIGWIERIEARYGNWRTVAMAIFLMGVVFLLFAVKTLLAWAIAVIAIVGLLCKFAEGARGLWIQSARNADVPIGHAVGALLATRSLARMAQPFVLAALLGVADDVAVIIIGVFCLICALAFSCIAREKLQLARPEPQTVTSPSASAVPPASS